MFKPFCKGINCKSLALAIVAVFIFNGLTNYVIHELLMKGAYEASAALWRPAAEMQDYCWWMVAGQAIIAIFFTTLFAKGYEGTGIGEGFRFGILIGLFCAGSSFISYAVMPLPCAIACNWAIMGLVQSVGAGIVAALVYKKPQF